MEKCSNCNSDAKPLLGKRLRFLDRSSLEKLNDFLPDYLKSSSFCEKCSEYKPAVEVPHIYLKYKDYIQNLLKERERKKSQLVNLVSDLETQKSELYDNTFNIVIFSNTPSHIELIELVESYFIVDSGMWSTSSDNIDGVWGAVHDKIARKGEDSHNKLSEGFEKSKSSIKLNTFLRGGNTVVDFKYSFSELAGNGKILVYCQGTAGIDQKKNVPNFSGIYSKYNEKLNLLQDEIDVIDKIVLLKSPELLSKLIRTLVFVNS